MLKFLNLYFKISTLYLTMSYLAPKKAMSHDQVFWLLSQNRNFLVFLEKGNLGAKNGISDAIFVYILNNKEIII